MKKAKMTEDKPTQKEIDQVAKYWDEVRISVAEGRDVSTYRPSKELLRRVAEHNARQQALACTHPSTVMEFNQPWRCGECDRPLRFLSDYQIEELVSEHSS